MKPVIILETPTRIYRYVSKNNHTGVKLMCCNPTCSQLISGYLNPSEVIAIPYIILETLFPEDPSAKDLKRYCVNCAKDMFKEIVLGLKYLGV